MKRKYARFVLLMLSALILFCCTGIGASGTQSGFSTPPPGYIDEYSAPIPSGVYSRDGNGSLPSSYSMRQLGLLTSVTNQGGYGTCWAFSTFSAVESNLVKKGLADTSLDLSELQAVYYSFNPAKDPLGNFDGDYDYLTEPEYNMLTRGGVGMQLGIVLARWSGVVEENVMPYSDAEYSLRSDYPEEYSSELDKYHVQNIRWVNMAGGRDEVKRHIMEYGAGATGANVSDVGWDNLSTRRNYYQNTLEAPNHGVTIVGWDDNYSRNNFKSSLRPASDGAWLVRNNWGVYWHDSGYFWLSYEDTATQDITVCFYDVESADNYDYNYQYDGGTGYTNCTYGTIFANVFEAQHDEQIEAVGFALTNETDVDYSVSIYRNPTNPADPKSGELVQGAAASGTAVYSGYYTVKLAQPAVMSEGDRFSVVINMTVPDNGSVIMGSDKNYDWGWERGVCTAESGQSFAGYQYPNRCSWRDISANGENVRIKAYTNVTGLQNPEGFCATSSSNTVTLSWNAVEGATGYEIYMSPESDSYSLLASTTSTSYTYTQPAGNGICFFYKVRAINASETGPFSRSDYVRLPISYSLGSIGLSAVTVDVDQSKVASITYNPTYTSDRAVAYYTADESIATVTRDGVVTGVSPGSTTLHAYSRNGGRTASASVTVSEHVLYTSLSEKTATCTEPGWTEEISCSCCSLVIVESEAIPAKGHTEYVRLAAKPATCTEAGWTEEKKCSVCGATTLASTAIGAKGHTEYVSLAAKPATCTEAGYTQEKKCSVCQEVTLVSTVISATGHTEHVSLEATAATCTQAGRTQEKKCSVCQEVTLVSTVISATGHTEHVSLEATAATCTQAGRTQEKKCSVCQAVTLASTVISATGHTEHISLAAKPATCTEAGYTQEKSCSVCQAVTLASTATGIQPHTAKVTRAAKAATCTAAGNTVEERCTYCNMIMTAAVELPAFGHSYTHAVTEATCTAGGYTRHTCGTCGTAYTDGQTAALGHTDTDANERCDRCGANLSPSANCSCNCHSTNGFKQFIYKISKFFWKLFKIKQTCACGARHY